MKVLFFIIVILVVVSVSTPRSTEPYRFDHIQYFIDNYKEKK